MHVEDEYSLRRQFFMCEFTAGHKGLHYSATKRGENAGPDGTEVTPRRWGTDAELAEEIDFARPSATVTFDFAGTSLTPEQESLFRRAFRRGGQS
jgi:hypothetical protein